MRLFNRGHGRSTPTALKTRQTDEFADHALLELKSVGAEAIRRALEAREGRYMKSVLEDSYFQLESLVIVPKDREIARRFEEFLATHESVAPDFRRAFFKQVVQPEYRSSRGSLVRVNDGFSVTIQLRSESLETPTDEEGFQISLRGRRALFDAEAALSGPFKRGADPGGLGNAEAGAMNVRADTVGRAAATPQRGDRATGQASATLSVTLSDGRGIHPHQLALPALLGREPERAGAMAGWTGLPIDATYTSRQHLVVFELLGMAYYALADAASLAATRSDGVCLEPGRHYPLAPGQRVVLYLGTLPDQGGSPLPPGPADEYAVVELSLLPSVLQDAGTPRPRAVR